MLIHLTRKYTVAVLLISVLVFFILRFHTDFPITSQEAYESYQSFAIIKSGNNINLRDLSVSFITVYLRVPFIAVFGLNDFGVRISSILIGAISLILLYIWMDLIRKYLPYSDMNRQWMHLKLLIILWFIFSGGVIQTNLFNLADTTAIALILLGMVSFHKSSWFGTIFLLAAPFISLSSIPLVLVIFIYYRKIANFNIKWQYLMFVLLIFFVLSLVFNPGYLKSITEQSKIAILSPASYTWQIDRRLAYDQVEHSPFYTQEFNFNRFIHNKITYGINNFFYVLAGSINLDKISFPFQEPFSPGNINTKNQRLPYIFFFEVPLIFIGLLKLLQGRSKIIFIGLGGLLTMILSKSDTSFIYISPFILICCAVGLIAITRNLSSKLRIMFLTGSLLFFISSALSFQDVLRYHQKEWMAEEDFRQFQIWKYIKSYEDKYSEIHITDRLGDSQIYLLYYNKFAPMEASEKLKKYTFSSFKYLESDRKPNQLWVGLAGEFVGRFNQYKGVEQISDGRILAKFMEVRQPDQFLGDEIWVVKTVFDYEK